MTTEFDLIRGCYTITEQILIFTIQCLMTEYSKTKWIAVVVVVAALDAEAVVVDADATIAATTTAKLVAIDEAAPNIAFVN
ncbi:hypothetical protein ACTXT7_004050 [Hymenolepis weldensis]